MHETGTVVVGSAYVDLHGVSETGGGQSKSDVPPVGWVLGSQFFMSSRVTSVHSRRLRLVS